MACASGCGVQPTANYASCVTEVRKGGASRIFALKCDIPIVEGTPGVGEFDITDTTAWETQITSGDLAISPNVLLEKGKGSSNTIKFSSKDSERENNLSETINVQCYSGDLDGDVDYKYWNALKKGVKDGQLVVGYVDCNDMVYVLPDNVQPQGGDVREQDALTGSTYFDFDFLYSTDGEMIEPIYVSGLNATLDAI